jgi:hypothetical protein
VESDAADFSAVTTQPLLCPVPGWPQRGRHIRRPIQVGPPVPQPEPDRVGLGEPPVVDRAGAAQVRYGRAGTGVHTGTVPAGVQLASPPVQEGKHLTAAAAPLVVVGLHVVVERCVTAQAERGCQAHRLGGRGPALHVRLPQPDPHPEPVAGGLAAHVGRDQRPAHPGDGMYPAGRQVAPAAGSLGTADVDGDRGERPAPCAHGPQRRGRAGIEPPADGRPVRLTAALPVPAQPVTAGAAGPAGTGRPGRWLARRRLAGGGLAGSRLTGSRRARRRLPGRLRLRRLRPWRLRTRRLRTRGPRTRAACRADAGDDLAYHRRGARVGGTDGQPGMRGGGEHLVVLRVLQHLTARPEQPAPQAHCGRRLPPHPGRSHRPAARGLHADGVDPARQVSRAQLVGAGLAQVDRIAVVSHAPGRVAVQPVDGPVRRDGQQVPAEADRLRPHRSQRVARLRACPGCGQSRSVLAAVRGGGGRPGGCRARGPG